MRSLARFAAVFVALALAPAAAWAADTGRIAFVRQVDDRSIELRFDSTHDCPPGDDLQCAWFPFASRSGATSACSPPSPDVVYTGRLEQALLTQTATVVVPLLTDAGGTATATRYCLHVIGSDGVSHNVAEYVWAPVAAPVPSPTPTPTPTPAPTPAPAEPAEPRAPASPRRFVMRDGQNAMRDALREKFGRSYRRPHFYECQRFEDSSVFCRAHWSTARFRFNGWVDVTPVGTTAVTYEGSITRRSRSGHAKRKRIRFRGRL